ncbi:MAG: maleylpyruvate isomerase family mycothiol-dependent enzyme [Acidimicrobiales bacterium]
MAYEWITDALEETWTSLDRLLRPQPASAYDAPTPCPGWSVRDVVSHLLGFELMLHGTPVPAYEGPWPSHVRNPIGEINEAFVQTRRSEPGLQVLDEFRDAARRSLASLRSLSDDEWNKVGWSPEGERPYHRFQETRVLDSWIHLQDVRDALLQPEDDHGAGEQIVLNRFESALPYVFAKKMHSPEGATLRVNLIGRQARTIVLEIRDGRASAVGSLGGPATLEVTTPVALFWRRCAGRISADAFLSASSTDVRGDRSLAERFAQQLSIMI